MIWDLNTIQETIQHEGLDVLVVSYGGSCSNTLVKYLEKNKLKCNTPIWDKIICHCPQYIECNVPMIYIYDNPIKSFLSIKRQGHWETNQKKLSNHTNIVFSDEHLLQLMIRQFHEWTTRENVCILKSGELFEDTIVEKLETFLKRNIQHFPIPYKTPKTNLEQIPDDLKQLFETYKVEIDRINQF